MSFPWDVWGERRASCDETRGESERSSEILLEPIVSELEAPTPFRHACLLLGYSLGTCVSEVEF